HCRAESSWKRPEDLRPVRMLEALDLVLEQLETAGELFLAGSELLGHGARGLVEGVLLLDHRAGEPFEKQLVERLAGPDDERSQPRAMRERRGLADELPRPELDQLGARAA